MFRNIPQDFFETDKLNMRFRPIISFTEPSAEVDIGYKKGNQLIIGEGENWLKF